MGGAGRRDRTDGTRSYHDDDFEALDVLRDVAGRAAPPRPDRGDPPVESLPRVPDGVARVDQFLTAA